MILDFDWEDPQGARGPELRATWARLQIRVQGEVVTRFFDERVRSVRDYIILPLYPVAEWIATNWWFLLSETEPGSGSRRPRFPTRHNISFSREGFALPDFEISPIGRAVRLNWRPAAQSDWPGRFISSGSTVIPIASVETALRAFVEAVIGRLDSEGLEATFLHEEWLRLNDLSTDEQSFCRAAAALGLDGWSISPTAEQAMLRAHEVLREAPILEHEFLQAAEIDRLLDQLNHMQEERSLLTERIEPQQRLREMKKYFASTSSVQLAQPWEEGYEFAVELRNHLRASQSRFRTFEELVTFFAPHDSPVVPVDSRGLFDALLVSDVAGDPAFGIDKSRDEAKSFAFCRALCEYLQPAQSRATEARLVTSSHTERQKMNRAFAAEFLAPRHLLRERLSSSIVGSDEVETLAGEFGVSPFVIQHQLSNHQLVERIAP